MSATHAPAEASTVAGSQSDEQDLTRFGYPQRLRRTMSSFTSFCLAFSMITITGSIVGLFQPVLLQVGAVSTWFWLLALVGVLPVLAVFMHMAARIPVTGYAYQWASRITSPYYGWIVAVFGIITFTTGAVSIGVLLGSVYAPEFGLAATPQNAAYLSAGALSLGFIVNIVGIRLASRMNNGFAMAEIVGTSAITILLVIGVVLFFKDTQGLGVIVNNNGAGAVNGAPTPGVNYILASLLPILSLLGWEASADLAEETNNPRKVAPRAMLRAVIVSGLAGFVVMWVLVAAIKGPIPASLTRTNTIFWIVDVHLGNFVGFLFKIVAFGSMMGCIIANIAVATRLIFSVSRDRMLPFSGPLARVNQRFRTPIVAIVVLWIVCLIINLAGAGKIFRIVSMAAVAYYFTYGSTILGVLWGHFKRKIPDAPADHFGLGRWLVPVAVLGVAWCLAVILAYLLPSANYYVAGYFAVALAIGALFTIYAWWALRTRRAAVPAMHPPELASVSGTLAGEAGTLAGEVHELREHDDG
jgi:amino acid transporter